MDKNSNRGTWLKKEIACSDAFMDMKDIGKVLYMYFSLRQPIHKKGKNEWVITENADISFTYSDAEKDCRISQKRFTRGMDELINHGFVRLEYQGGGTKGNFSNYRMSQMWRNFGTDNFKILPRPKKTILVGCAKKSKQVKKNKSMNKKVRNIRDRAGAR